MSEQADNSTYYNGMTYDQFKQYIERELWQALEAVDNNDLPTVRSSAARVNRATIDAWQSIRKSAQ